MSAFESASDSVTTASADSAFGEAATTDTWASDGGGFDDGWDGGDHRGPFAPDINATLSASFGRSLDGLSVQRQGETSRALDAHAYTIGSTISLGDRVREDVNDPFSMEVIAHEVAHALAGGGSGETLVDQGASDAGETAAHAASSAFRDFVSAGRSGPAPRLAPAYGGQATIHRFEAGEHADAVDHIEENMKDPSKLDPAVKKAMEQKITLSNGVTVTQGQITAMMGDFYGAYDKNGKFDPLASFEAMDQADPEEMKKLQAKIVKEQADVKTAKDGGEAFEPTANADFESLTNDRHKFQTSNGSTSGFSYMDLAQKNTNHFNKEDETDTDGNAGSYAVLHKAAMEQAQAVASMADGPEKDAAQQKALALEASAQHFMTDRFSGGHQYDKQQMVQDNGGGVDGNLRSRVMHDKGNEDGVWVTNGDGETWHALGDEHWADADNKDNRDKAATATAASYGDITKIMNGETTADDTDPMGTFHATSPKWDGDHNDEVQQEGKDLSYPEMLWKEKGQALLLPAMAETWAKDKLHQVQDSETWHDIKEGAGAAWDWTKGAASDAWDWTKGAAETVGQGASDAWDWTKEKGGELLDWGGQQASDAWDWTKGAASDVADGASEAWNTVSDGAVSVYHDVANGAGEAWDTVSTGAGEAWDTVSTGASEAYDTVSTGAGQAWDTVSTGAGEAWDAVSSGAASAVDTAGTALSDGASWVGDQAGAAKDAFLGLFD